MHTIRSADHALMREMNLALLLECLRREAPLSRADLALITGLTKAAVSSLVRELIEARYVRELGPDVGNKGRPSVPLELNPNVGYLLGAEIGVDSISVILTNFAAQVIWRHDEPLATREQSAVLARLVAIVNLAWAETRAHQQTILGLGLGLPGLVNVGTGTLLFSPNLGWTDVPLRDLLQAQFPFPIHIDNEANMAALGESYFGAARGSDLVLHLSCNVGVGAGLVVNRRLFSGIGGLAGEVGHMTIDPDGPPCNCGNRGCWETYVSKWAVLRRVQEAILSGRPTRLLDTIGHDLQQLTIPMIVDAARRGDSVARAALAETGTFLGIGLAGLINALNPERVVFGGVLSLAHEFILPTLREEVRKRAMHWAADAAEIVVAAHGTDACVMGGIATVYYRVLTEPLPDTTRAARPAMAAGQPAWA